MTPSLPAPPGGPPCPGKPLGPSAPCCPLSPVGPDVPGCPVSPLGPAFPSLPRFPLGPRKPYGEKIQNTSLYGCTRNSNSIMQINDNTNQSNFMLTGKPPSPRSPGCPDVP